MFESLLMTLSLASNAICIPYDPRPVRVSDECYFTTTQVTANTEHMFHDRDLADLICAYTDRPVYAFYQANNYTPLGFAMTVDPSNPIINDIKPLSNTYDDLIFMVQELESAAASYGFSGSELKNAVLGYIRTTTARYSLRTTLPDEINLNTLYTLFKNVGMSVGWYAFAGPDQQASDWFLYARTHSGAHKNYSPMNRFFARFAESSEYDSRHGYLDTDFPYCWSDSSKTITDFNGEGNIDVLHMFATLDANIDDTTQHPFNLSGRYFEREIAGWAGDLQTLTKRISNRYGDGIPDNLTFENLMNLPDSSFSFDDLLADIDGKNISILVNNESLGMSLSQCLSFYRFLVSQNPTDRYSSFCQNIVTSMLGSGTVATAETVDKAAHLALGRSFNGSAYENDDLRKLDYALLIGETDASIRDRVASLFADYLCEKGGIL